MAKKSVGQQRGDRACKIARAMRELEDMTQTLHNDLYEAVVKAAQEVLTEARTVAIQKWLEEATDVSDLYDEAEEKRSNMEEKFSQTDKYQALEDMVNQLSEVKDVVDNLDLEVPNLTELQDIWNYQEKLEEAAGQLAEAAGTLEGLEF